MDTDLLKKLVKMVEEEGYTVSKAEKELSKVYLPEVDEQYYTISTLEVCLTQRWSNSELDEHRLASGNCFRTAQEAENYKALTYATTRVINRLRELEGDWVADWDDHRQGKYKAQYNYDTDRLETSYSFHIKSPPLGRHSSIEAWESVIEEMPEDVKLMLGVCN